MIVALLSTVVIVLIYRHRFSIFKRCRVCGKWPWQMFDEIIETPRGMICPTCREQNDI
jgi:hypothetical protein